MTDNRKSGIALIVGSVGGILTMAIHPTGAGPLTAGQIAHLSLVSGVAHSLAIASVIILFLGACGLAQSIAARDRLSFAAVVVFAFACVAIFIAAAVSGFIVPAILMHMSHDAPNNELQWRIAIDAIFQINQAFARIYSVAASLAVILWSVSALRNGGLGRALSAYGCVVSALIILGIVVGHLRLNVHGMAVVWISQALWFTLAGVSLLSRPPVGVSAA